MTTPNKYWTLAKSNPLKIITLIVALIVVYLVYSHEHSKKVAQQVYQEMVVMDQQLDQLQESANMISSQKSSNDKLIGALKALTKDNFMASKADVIQLVKQLDYAPQIESSLLNSLNAASPSNYALQSKNITAQIRLLKYQHDLSITQFNQQISTLSTQVTTIKNQINSISNDSLHDLELAKLQFISHKLTKTMHLLKESLLQEVLDGEATEARLSASGATN
jgi:hypothetical protein